jgi:hypothetical protein
MCDVPRRGDDVRCGALLRCLGGVNSHAAFKAKVASLLLLTKFVCCQAL